MPCRDLERVQSLLARLPERPRDEAKVGRAVVRPLEHGAQRAVALLRERERVEHGRVADAQAHLAERDPHQVLGRGGVEVGKQGGEIGELLLLAARAARAGDASQPTVHVDNGRRLVFGRPGQALGRDAEVARLPVELDHLFFGHAVGGGDRGHEQPLAEADLDRLEEWRQAALGQVGDRPQLAG